MWEGQCARRQPATTKGKEGKKKVRKGREGGEKACQVRKMFTKSPQYFFFWGGHLFAWQSENRQRVGLRRRGSIPMQCRPSHRPTKSTWSRVQHMQPCRLVLERRRVAAVRRRSERRAGKSPPCACFSQQERQCSRCCSASCSLSRNRRLQTQ